MYLNVDYLFSPHFGISTILTSLIDADNSGTFIGPMFSTAIDSKERFEFDVKPRIGYGGKFLFDMGASLRFNLGNHFSLSGNFDFYPSTERDYTKEDYTTTPYRIEEIIEKSPVMGLSLGAVYRFNPAKRKGVSEKKTAPEWIYRSKTNRFGIKAGYNQANTTSCTVKAGENMIEIYGTDRWKAFHVGLFDNYSFTNRIGLQVEGLFSL
jgi:hypothetical protein